jgi:uncharacterized protein (DUF1697 family)
MAGCYVALLRGINVAGKNKLPMKTLAAIFEAAGCADVRTYIQSGNVVFRVPRAKASRLPEKVAQAIEEQLGFRSPVVMRTSEELEAVVQGNPFLRAGADPVSLHVMFLADRPSAAAVATLDPNRSPGDELIIEGRDVYLKLPNGVGRTKLTNDYIDRTLKTTSTVRNWRTVLALLELCKA